jgi:hypothetical protein
MAVVAAACVALPATVSAGPSDAPTREEWSRQANDICRPVVKRNTELLERSSELADERRYTRAGRLFIKAWRNSLDAFDRIAKLERPDGDRDRIRRWIEGERRALRVAIEAGRELKQGHEAKFDRIYDRAVRINRRAQRAVRGFDLDVCIP